MARVQYGIIITDLKGSIGGVTFQNNTSGKIVRTRPIQLKKYTAPQNLTQQRFYNWVSRYSSLLFAQQLLWQAFASAHTKVNLFNETKTLNGQNWFISVNENLRIINQSFTLSPPAYTLPPSVDPYSLTLRPIDMVIDFGAGFSPANSDIVIRTTPPLRTSKGMFRGKLRLTKVIDVQPFTNYDIQSEWSSVHNLQWPPSSNDDVFYIACMISTIEKSTGLESPGLIVISKLN
jgi:hypothetical protein